MATPNNTSEAENGVLILAATEKSNLTKKVKVALTHCLLRRHDISRLSSKQLTPERYKFWIQSLEAVWDNYKVNIGGVSYTFKYLIDKELGLGDINTSLENNEQPHSNINDTWLYGANFTGEFTAHSFTRFHFLCAYISILRSSLNDKFPLALKDADNQAFKKFLEAVQTSGSIPIAEIESTYKDFIKPIKISLPSSDPSGSQTSDTSADSWLDKKFLGVVYLSVPTPANVNFPAEGVDKAVKNTKALFDLKLDYVIGCIIFKRIDGCSAYTTEEWTATSIDKDGKFHDRGEPFTKIALFTKTCFINHYKTRRAPTQDQHAYVEYSGILTGDSNDKIPLIHEELEALERFEGFYCWTDEDHRIREQFSNEVSLWRGRHFTQIVEATDLEEELQVKTLFEDYVDETGEMVDLDNPTGEGGLKNMSKIGEYLKSNHGALRRRFRHFL